MLIYDYVRSYDASQNGIEILYLFTVATHASIYLHKLRNA